LLAQLWQELWIGLFIVLILIGVFSGQSIVVGFGAMGLLMTGVSWLWARVSLDHVTYERILPKRRVFIGPSAYSSLSAGRLGTPSEGQIFILLEGGKTHRYEDGHFARFNLSWLLGGKKTGDGKLPKWVDAAGR